MMDFPSSPVVGQQYPVVPINGVPVYVWDGVKWKGTLAASMYAASDVLPLMNGTASAGVGVDYTRFDHRHPTDTTRVAKAGDTMTGHLTLPTGPGAANAVRKDYVDAQAQSGATSKVSKSGDTMTGQLVISLTGDQLRYRASAYTLINRNDNGNYYMLLTNNGDPDGGWNNLRPFRINLGTGDVTMEQKLNVGGALTVTSGGATLYGWGGNNNSGVLFLNAGQDRYLYYDGSRYQFPGSPIGIAYPGIGTDAARVDWVDNNYQPRLGFTPVRQSGGAYQGTNTVYMGWDGGGLRGQVDGSDMGRFFMENSNPAVASIRLAYLGDQFIGADGMNESWGGGVVTGGGYMSDGFSYRVKLRYRQLQKLVSGGWPAVDYV